MKKTFFLYFFALIFFIQPVFSTIGFSCFSGSVFSDTFSYTDAYTNHGWSAFDNGICTDAQLPPSPNITGTFGVNLTGCGADTNYRIDKLNFPLNIHNQSFVVNYDLNIMQKTAPTNKIQYFDWVCEPDGNPCIAINFYNNRSIQINSAFSTTNVFCDGGFFDFNVSSTYTFIANLTGKKYSFYRNGAIAGDCENKNISSGMDLSGTDFITVHQVQNSAFTSQYMDNFEMCEAIVSDNTTPCSFPSLFCDTFNYNALISTHGWIPYGNVGVIDDTIYPTNNKLVLFAAKIQNPAHTTGNIPISYQIDATTAAISSPYAPVFSSEMQLNITQGGFSYTAGINQYGIAYIISAVDDTNGTLSWKYGLSNGSFAVLCDSCSPINYSGKLKINTYFGQRSKYPFNTSNTADYIDVYLDSTKLGTVHGLMDNISDYLAYYEVNKDTGWQFSIDDYYVMAGIDKYVNTVPLFFSPLFTLPNTTTSTGQGSSDVYTNAQTLWEQLGLRTAASRVFAASIIMFLVAIVTIAAHLYAKIMPHPVTIALVEVMTALMLTFIGLLPVWIMILFGLILLVGFCLFLFRSMKTSGS